MEDRAWHYFSAVTFCDTMFPGARFAGRCRPSTTIISHACFCSPSLFLFRRPVTPWLPSPCHVGIGMNEFGAVPTGAVPGPGVTGFGEMAVGQAAAGPVVSVRGRTTLAHVGVRLVASVGCFDLTGGNCCRRCRWRCLSHRCYRHCYDRRCQRRFHPRGGVACTVQRWRWDGGCTSRTNITLARTRI